MRIYLAGIYAGGRGEASKEVTSHTYVTKNVKVPFILESFHYMSDRSMEQIRSGGDTIFLDSGAFSMFTQGVTIDLSTYAAFIKKYQELIHVASNLDAIGRGGEKVTYDRQKELEKLGVVIQPVFHVRDSEEWLTKYLDEGYDYIFIGGMVPESTQYLKVRLDFLWKNYLTKPDGTPRVKVHGFGLTALPLMFRYPWFCMTEEDHQVLSRTGWKGLSEIILGEEILCFDKGKSFWSPVLELPKFKVKDIDLTYLSNRNFSASVTPNHRWQCQGRDSKKWEWRTTDRLTPATLIPRTGNYVGPEKKKYPDWFVELMAWYWTEGHIKDRSKKYIKNSITISQSQSINPEKVKMIRKALIKGKEKFCEFTSVRKIGKSKNPGKIEKTFELYGHVRDQLLALSPKKEIPLSWIWDLTKEQLILFIKISVLGDGTKSRLLRKEGFTLAQRQKFNIDPFRIACLLAGIPTSRWNENKHGMTGICSSSVNFIWPAELKRETKKYTGNIWCVRVASGAFFTKSKEHIYVTGNSVDSTSWVMTSRFGSIYLDLPGRGGKIRDVKIDFSDRSTKKEILNSWHYAALRKPEQELVLSRLNEMEDARVKDPDLEAQLASWMGVKQGFNPEALGFSYGWRDYANISYFIRAMDRGVSRFIPEQETLFQ